jgi:hypothetical protein
MRKHLGERALTILAAATGAWIFGAAGVDIGGFLRSGASAVTGSGA